MKKLLSLLLYAIFISFTILKAQTNNNVSNRTKPSGIVAFKVPGYPLLGKLEISGMGDEANTTSSISTNIYYYLPLFAFKKDADTFVIKKIDANTISFPIIWETNNTKSIFFNYCLKNKLIDSNAREGNVRLVDFNHLSIETRYRTPQITLLDESDYVVPGTESNLVHTFENSVLADNFIKDFKNGQIHFNANIVVEGKDFKENSAIITYDDIKSTSVFNSIDGPSGKNILTRKKIGNLVSQAIRKERIDIISEFDDPDFKMLFDMLLKDFSNSVKSSLKADERLENQFQNLGIDTTEFKSDIITASKSHMSKVDQEHFEKELNTASSVGGGFSFLGIGLNAKVTDANKQKTVEDVLKKDEIDYDETGSRFIPKTIRIFQLDSSHLKSQGEFIIGSKRKITASKQINLPIDQQTNTLPNMPSHAEEANAFAPLGTIISSYFNWEEFQKATKNNEENPSGTDEWKSEYSKWAPADGRNVRGSNFEMITHEKNVPDYRGTFLRGLNTFDPNEKIKVSADQTDSDGLQRTRDSFELDAFKTHNHAIRLNYGIDPTMVMGMDGNNYATTLKKLFDRHVRVDPPVDYNQPSANTAADVYYNDIIWGNGGKETRPKNKAIYYYIRIN